MTLIVDGKGMYILYCTKEDLTKRNISYGMVNGEQQWKVTTSQPNAARAKVKSRQQGARYKEGETHR